MGSIDAQTTWSDAKEGAKLQLTRPEQQLPWSEIVTVWSTTLIHLPQRSPHTHLYPVFLLYPLQNRQRLLLPTDISRERFLIPS